MDHFAVVFPEEIFEYVIPIPTPGVLNKTFHREYVYHLVSRLLQIGANLYQYAFVTQLTVLVICLVFACSEDTSHPDVRVVRENLVDVSFLAVSVVLMKHVGMCNVL